MEGIPHLWSAIGEDSFEIVGTIPKVTSFLSELMHSFLARFPLEEAYKLLEIVPAVK